MENQDWFAYYERYGLMLPTRSGSNRAGTCYGCGQKNKLFVEPKEGTYHCKLCDVKGNNVTFIRAIHTEALQRKKNPLIVKLAKMKKIPLSTLKSSGVIQHGEEVFIPQWDQKHRLVGLRPFDFKNNRIVNVIGQPLRPNFWKWDQSIDTTYIYEADFDSLAYQTMVDKHKGNLPPHNLVALCGTSYKSDWNKYFKGKKTIWCFDHDVEKGNEGNKFYPGEKGVEKAYEITDGCTANFKWLDWGKKRFKRPFDVRDLSVKFRKDTTKFFDTVNNITEDFRDDHKSTSVDKVKPMKITSFNQLCEEFSKSIQFNPTLRRTLAISCATALSAKTKGDAIWMFIVGPASSGKTTILDAFSACYEQTIHRSTLTKTALVSGRNMDEDTDPSILPRLNNKCLIIKDLTMLLTANVSAQEETFGTLRDAYDSSISVSYGNGVTREYSNLRFSWLSGVTDIIQSFNKSDAGERFLRVDIVDPTFDEALQIRKALQNLSKDSHTDSLRAATAGFINYMWEQQYEENLPDLTESDIHKLEALAQVISYMRTKVKKNREGAIEYRVRKEVGTRVAKQLGKVIQLLNVVFQTKELSEEDFQNHILKVAVDTCASIQTEITAQLMKQFTRIGGATVELLADKLQLGKSTIQNHLSNMQEVGFVEFSKRSNNSGQRGRKYKLWVPTEHFESLWDQAGLNSYDHKINAGLVKKVRDKSSKMVKTRRTNNEKRRVAK